MSEHTGPQGLHSTFYSATNLGEQGRGVEQISNAANTE